MKTEAEEKIIEAAREVFFERGYNGATMRDIASVAGVNLALLHYYYRTKENIFEIVITQSLDTVFKRLNRVFTSDLDIFCKIEHIAKCYIGIGMEYPKLPGFIMRELEINKDILGPIIVNFKKEHEIDSGLSVFRNDLAKAVENKIIKPVRAESLLIDILSLSLFPFVAKNFISGTILNEKKYADLLKERSKHISNLVIGEIKV